MQDPTANPSEQDAEATALPAIPGLPRALTAPELRVLGCLLEKAATTPEQYPLTLNSLRLACNQKTARDPVVEYDERTVGIAARTLGELKFVKDVHPQDRGAVRFEHRFNTALDLRQPAVAVLAVLMLRGAQTSAEIRQNAHRLHEFETLGHLEDVLERLEGKRMIVKLGRSPGQREERFVHRLGGEELANAQAMRISSGAARPSPGTDALKQLGDVSEQMAALQQMVSQLREETVELRARIETLEAVLA